MAPMFRRRGLPLLIRRRVLVHTKDGVSTLGVLAGIYPDCVVISHGSELLSDGKGVPLAGDRTILIGNVSSIDEPGADLGGDA